MIIKELRLINFGKFNHKAVSLEPGINIIYGENEAGKTTLHTFIRGMLFGIEKQRGKASVKDLYSKYEPWENPGNYQGIMRIENAGVNYRLERNFSKEHKSFKVVDEDHGRELSAQEIEELFTGLDEGCYYNTISISQLGSTTDKELENILKNYAANLGATKSMEINIKEAYEDLDNQRKKIASEYKISEEDIVQKAIRNAKEQLEISESEQHTIIAGMEQKKEARKNLQIRKNELSVQDAKRREERNRQSERKDKLYQDVIFYNADVEKYTETLNQVRTHKAQLQDTLTQKGIDSVQTMEMLTEKVVNKTNMPIVFIFLMMASIGVSIGLFVGNFQLLNLREYWIKPLLAALVAIIFGALSVGKYIFNRSRKHKKMEALKQLRQTFEKLEAAKHEEVYVERQLNNKKDSLAETQRLLAIEESKNLQKDDCSGEIQELEEKERKLNDEISKAQWMLEQKKERDIETERRIEELDERYDKIQKAKLEIEAIEEAKKTIEEIADEIRQSFGKRLNERASYYISNITNGKYNSLTIDERLNISINSKNLLVAASKLSKGTIEQVYMALRLAAADIIFEDDKKPILLDDAFVMYDNKRMGNTMKFMAENMEQVILFSCHTREKVMADKMGIKYNLIVL